MTKGAGAHLGIDLSEYDARIRTFVPDYDLMHEVVADALRASLRRRSPVIVELGIGTGALAARALEAFPSARIVGVDTDAAMLAAARARLANHVRTLEGRFEAVDLPRCDAIIACLSLHHVPPGATRLRLFRRLRRALGPGGVLVSADNLPAKNPRIAASDHAVRVAQLEQFYTPQEVREFFRRWATEDYYVPLPDELDTLRRAGFAADVVLRRRGFAVIVAS